MNGKVVVTEGLQGNYEQRKKAFKAAGKQQSSRFIPQSGMNGPSGNNRKEKNGRGVNPRMLNVQRAPIQHRVIVGTTKTHGKPVVALVKTVSMRKITHIRPIPVIPVIDKPE